MVLFDNLAAMLALAVLLTAASACEFPLLPDTLLKLAPSYEVTGSINTFGRFLITSNSTLCVSFDPVNVNLEAVLGTKAKVHAQRTVAVDGHALITARLKAGMYALKMEFDPELREDDRNEENTRDCDQPYLYLSLAVLPLTEMQKLSKADLKSFTPGFPALEVKDAMEKFEKYKLMDTSRFVDIGAVDEAPLAVLAEFRLDARIATEEEAALGHTGLWKMSLSVHHEFVELGGIALMLHRDSNTVPESLSCTTSGSCVIGHRYDKNSVSLVTAVTPGNFTLWALYLDLTAQEKSTLKEFQGGLIPFSVNFLLEPMTEREDRFNCEAGRLPVSLNAPGFMDKDGYLAYHDNVYADIYSICQQTHVSIPVDSILRLVTVEPAGVGVDVKLLGVQGETIALSETVGGTEGIVIELQKGEYTLDFTFENTMITNPRHVFCETFLLELDIMPASAAKDYIKTYQLDTCRDDTDTLAALLDENVKLLNDKKKGAFLVEPDKGAFFLLPVASVSAGDEKVFEYPLTLSKSSYVFFEVLSHPVLADLTVLLKRVIEADNTEDVFGDYTDALSLDRNSRRWFHGRVNAGKYVLHIKTGPGAKNRGQSKSRPSITDADFHTLPKCVAFQLRAEVLPMLESTYKQWTCEGSNFSLPPNSMNTVEKLGFKGMNQGFVPRSGFFGQKLLPPFRNTKTQDPTKIGIFLEKESVLRVSSTSETGGIVLSLQTGNKDLQKVGAKQLSPGETVTLGAVLQAHQNFALVISYYPLENRDCGTYDLNVEIRTLETVAVGKTAQCGLYRNCEDRLPDKDALVRYRTLEDLDPQFEMSSGEYSSSLHDSDFQFYHRRDNGRLTVPFQITSELAVVTAHLQTALVESGLRFFIESEDGETAAYGQYESAHRMETYAVVLSSGKYNVVFEETGTGPSNVCVRFSAAVLVEAEDQWDSYDALLRKTNDCGFVDLPQTLNIIGELEEGGLHWHREIPLDAGNMGHRFPFRLDSPSVLHLAVEPVTDISFFARIFQVSKPPYRLVASKEATKGLHAKLEAGNYFLDLAYGSDSDLPHPSECEVFVMDLQIVPEDVYTQLAQQNSCTSSSNFPTSLSAKKSPETKYLIHTSSQYDHRAKIDTQVDSEMHFDLSYESALIGPMVMELYDAQGLKVQTSAGVQDYVSLTVAVPPGTYALRVASSWLGDLTPVCAKMTFTFSIEETVLLAQECEGSDLPSKLYSEETAAYGGPQAKDGSVSFYGVFRIPENRMSDKLLMRVGETSIGRVMTISSTPGVYIEAMLYKDSKMTQTVGFSKSEGRAGSFILELEAKYEPYVLELVYVKHKAKATCATFEIAVEIEEKDAVKEKLTCTPDHDSTLPDRTISLTHGDSVSGQQYAVRGSWLIGDPSTFPAGVASLGVRNAPFVYQMELDVKLGGRFSATVEFDFLTNDIYLQVLRGDKPIGKSYWMVIGEKLNEDLELASTLEEVGLEKGTYTLVLRQAVAANHLAQLFDSQELCFPFSFTVDLQPPVTDSTGDDVHLNKLVSVTPSEKSEINPQKGLAIIITWEGPIHKGKSGSYVKAFYLETEKRIKIHPDIVRQEKSKPHKLELTFKGGQLPAGTCFKLKLNVGDLNLGDEDLQPEYSPSSKYAYCTSNCACNPKSEAKCSDEMECICPPPYAGVTCEECVEGYSYEAGLCLKNDCVNCPGVCVTGVCRPDSECDCGEHGHCIGSICECSPGFSGEKCNLCKDQDMVFPYCESCEFEPLPANITRAEPAKGRINRKGEFTFTADRVEKKEQTVVMKLEKRSKLTVEMGGNLMDTKVTLSRNSRRSLKPRSDAAEDSIRTLTWSVDPDQVYSLIFRSSPQAPCDFFTLSFDIRPEEEATSEESVAAASQTVTECAGHGHTGADGKCECDVGYVGSSCSKCDEEFEINASGVCAQKLTPPPIAPPPPTPVQAVTPPMQSSEGDVSLLTIVFGLALAAIGAYVIYWLYQANIAKSRKARYANASGFEGPEDEEERTSLQPTAAQETHDPLA